MGSLTLPIMLQHTMELSKYQCHSFCCERKREANAVINPVARTQWEIEIHI